MVIVDLISDLLYSNNCVILPSFGGFVGNVKSTEVNHTRAKVIPQRKRIAFNQSLQENDGVLAQALMKREGISFEEAEKQIRQFVAHLNDRLKRFKNVELKHVGSLYLNKEDKLVFVPYDGLNFFKPSFGLTELKLRKVVAKPVVEEDETPIVPIRKRQSLFLPQIAAAVAIFFIFGVMMWQLLRNSAYNDIVNNQTPVSVEESIASILPEVNTPSNEEIEAKATPEMEATSIDMEQPEETAVDEEVSDVDKDDTEEVVEPIEDVTIDVFAAETIYYIAVAKNYTSETGDKMRSRMERKEYTVTEKEMNEDLVMVIEKFYSETNAKQFLRLVKQYDYKSAFIYTNQE